VSVKGVVVTDPWCLSRVGHPIPAGEG